MVHQDRLLARIDLLEEQLLFYKNHAYGVCEDVMPLDVPSQVYTATPPDPLPRFSFLFFWERGKGGG